MKVNLSLSLRLPKPAENTIDSQEADKCTIAQIKQAFSKRQDRVKSFETRLFHHRSVVINFIVLKPCLASHKVSWRMVLTCAEV